MFSQKLGLISEQTIPVPDTCTEKEHSEEKGLPVSSGRCRANVLRICNVTNRICNPQNSHRSQKSIKITVQHSNCTVVFLSAQHKDQIFRTQFFVFLIRSKHNRYNGANSVLKYPTYASHASLYRLFGARCIIPVSVTVLCWCGVCW